MAALLPWVCKAVVKRSFLFFFARSAVINITGSALEYSSPGTGVMDTQGLHTLYSSMEKVKALNPSFAALGGNPMDGVVLSSSEESDSDYSDDNNRCVCV